MRTITTRAWRLLTASAVTSAAIAGAMSASGAEVWRCGSSYSDRPCEHGQAVDIEDARSDDQRRDALQGTKANAATASDLERQRHRAHARQPGPVLIGAPPSTPASVKPKYRPTGTTKATPKKGKGHSSGDFVASYPTPADPNKKSRKGNGKN